MRRNSLGVSCALITLLMIWQADSLVADRQVQKGHRQGKSSKGSKIPNILHYIYLGGFEAYEEETRTPGSLMLPSYRESCMAVHKHWKIMFWTEEMAVDLLTKHYKWFLPIYQTYDIEVKRADAIRPFILLHYGGLYLDLDNECYSPAESTFKDYDVVLQGTGFEGLNNGMMASRPGHPLMLKMIEQLMLRYKGSTTELWKNNPVHMTGPKVLTDCVQDYFKLEYPVSGWLTRTYHVDSTSIKIYPIGQFFVPCWVVDYLCFQRFERGLASGVLDMDVIVGRHWFASSWNKPHLIGNTTKGTHN